MGLFPLRNGVFLMITEMGFVHAFGQCFGHRLGQEFENRYERLRELPNKDSDNKFGFVVGWSS